jgi:UDP-N-acetylglucosamine--N-acetylmuramyl-(pentapeptide) pyrophosphoryl-undecaprenol N-acetylglucosamine transferase
MKLLFTGGGSGGHVYPAIALIQKIRSIDPDVELLYIGKKGSYEERICQQEKIPFEAIKVQYLYRKLIYKNFGTMIDFFKATKRVKTLMQDFKPDVIIGTGGYVSSPVIYMGHKLKIKTIIHEQNSVPGLTNKWLSRYVDAVAISVEESRKHFKHKNIVLTGNPRAYQVIQSKKANKKDLGLSPQKRLLLIFFGSQGAKYVNQKIADILPILDQEDDLETIFVTGKNHYDEINSKLKPQALQQVQIKDYLDNMPDYLSVCDLVLCRAGATTISELTALGIPAIYIPSPNVTNNHQEKNAQILKDHKAGLLIREKDLSHEGLIASLQSLLKNEGQLKGMGENGKKLANVDGINQFIDLIYH